MSEELQAGVFEGEEPEEDIPEEECGVFSSSSVSNELTPAVTVFSGEEAEDDIEEEQCEITSQNFSSSVSPPPSQNKTSQNHTQQINQQILKVKQPESKLQADLYAHYQAIYKIMENKHGACDRTINKAMGNISISLSLLGPLFQDIADGLQKTKRHLTETTLSITHLNRTMNFW
ncbi:uncharacterized protein MONOS_6491 [Monocercomonoides exilis]|uniref:uncharacterized protein n=1 Tax=Monocercomonoides exilis TaxID=2049356 RepID=UPI003559711A|nr:hypothetical protein MONOS_6491 [Monocercomonoides exilis]|eukprot:MONOS_6491.1-p1 / transcript=MONOS_6491.1 / gene=MONOS_6491 / organism=Monocercomonoides_exilis_PA203 / gene_product=unspecified product / transcript_product=unspecified product / location=Mono_scaffold00205:47203-47962(-) / protein_length=175 / sequence_SO=supercontig / SO=protein_coding / is_pseudo=false